jgi:hypothetical protein
MTENGKYVNWHESFIGGVKSFFNQLFADKIAEETLWGCMNKRIPGLQHSLVYPLVDSVVDFVTNGTGIIHHSFAPPLPVPRIASQLVNLTIESMTLGGLDSFEEVALIEPSKNNNISILSTIRMKNLGVTFVTRANSSVVAGFSEAFSLSTTLSNVTLSIEMAIAVNKNTFQSLFIEQLVSHPLCWLSSLDYFNLTSIIVDVNISDITISQLSCQS